MKKLLIALACATVSYSAVAGGNIDAGKALTEKYSCFACHGKDFNSPIDPTIEHEIDDRFLRVMGIPPKKDKVEPEKQDDEEQLLAQEDDKKKKDKEPEIVQ